MHLEDTVDNDKVRGRGERVTSLMNRSYWFQKNRPQLSVKQARLAKFFGANPPERLKRHCPTRWLYDFRRLRAFIKTRRVRCNPKY